MACGGSGLGFRPDDTHAATALFKDLFTFKEDTDSDTHDSFQCQRCRNDQAYVV